MCKVIEFGSEIIDGGDDLKRIVGEHNIVMNDYLSADYKLEDRECLCHVDIEATAKQAGMKCERHPDGWPDWILSAPITDCP